MKLVVITRPATEAVPLAETLRAQGFRTLVEPMLTIRPTLEKVPKLAGVQALVFTSINGVRSFSERTNERDQPVYAVGEATAAAARLAGFSAVSSAEGTAAQLAQLIRQEVDPRRGRLLHVSGAHVASDLARLLREEGFEAERLVTYQTDAATGLSPRLADAFLTGEADSTMFFSPRTGEIFASLAIAANLKEACGRVAALCVSSAVADSIQDVRWRTLSVAERPTQSAMIDLLNQEQAKGAGG